MRSPASVPVNDSNDSLSDDDRASRTQVERLKGQVGELRKCVSAIVKNHANDIDSSKVLARMAQRSNGSIRDELNETNLEIGESISKHEQRLVK